MSKKESFVKVTVNMPKPHHRKLKAIAAIKGIGLSSYIMECLDNVVLRGKEDEEVDGKNSFSDEAVKEVEELIEAQS